MISPDTLKKMASIRSRVGELRQELYELSLADPELYKQLGGTRWRFISVAEF